MPINLRNLCLSQLGVSILTLQFQCRLQIHFLEQGMLGCHNIGSDFARMHSIRLFSKTQACLGKKAEKSATEMSLHLFL